jgi:hypothetical protein
MFLFRGVLGCYLVTMILVVCVVYLKNYDLNQIIRST